MATPRVAPKPPGPKQDGRPKSDAEVLAELVGSLENLSRRVPKGPLREKADEAWRAAKILEVRGEVAKAKADTTEMLNWGPVLKDTSASYSLDALLDRAATVAALSEALALVLKEHDDEQGYAEAVVLEVLHEAAGLAGALVETALERVRAQAANEAAPAQTEAAA